MNVDVAHKVLKNFELRLYDGYEVLPKQISSLTRFSSWAVHTECPENPDEPSILCVYSDSLEPSIMLWSPGLDLGLPVVVAVAPGPVAPDRPGSGSDPGRRPGQGCQSSGWPPAAIALQGSSPHRTERSEGHVESTRQQLK